MNNNITITEQELELIDNYLAGRLTGADKAAFEAQLAGNEEWKAKFSQVKLLAIGIQEAALREQLPQFHGEAEHYKKLASVKNINWIKRLSIAASVIAIISVLGWVLFFKQPAEEKMYTAFYKPDPGLSTEMGLSDNYIFDRAMVDYKTANYKAALESWNKLLAVNAGNDTLHYFIASAQMADNNPTAAIAGFDKVLQNHQSVFTNDALWYKGLALLKKGKKQEAIAAIEKAEHSQKQTLLLKLKE
ncbi:MAG: hypothetical protein H7Y86_00805 [Rhizobacter sp.]|nr:hypothetical protein [Ferruginibacter sp.]